MAVTSFDYTTSLDVNLRDTSGGESIYGSHHMKIVHLTGATGTYDAGGLVIDPAMFDFTRLDYVNSQSTLVMEVDGALIKVCEFGLSSQPNGSGGLDWIWSVFAFDGDSYPEQETGQDVSFPEGLTVTFLLVGT
jgi:hypothetical protein